MRVNTRDELRNVSMWRRIEKRFEEDTHELSIMFYNYFKLYCSSNPKKKDCMRVNTRDDLRNVSMWRRIEKRFEEESFSGAYSIYTYQRWEWLITASFPYIVVLIASPLPPLLYSSLSFNFNPLFIYWLDIITQNRLAFFYFDS